MPVYPARIREAHRPLEVIQIHPSRRIVVIIIDPESEDRFASFGLGDVFVVDVVLPVVVGDEPGAAEDHELGLVDG